MSPTQFYSNQFLARGTTAYFKLFSTNFIWSSLLYNFVHTVSESISWPLSKFLDKKDFGKQNQFWTKNVVFTHFVPLPQGCGTIWTKVLFKPNFFPSLYSPNTHISLSQFNAKTQLCQNCFKQMLRFWSVLAYLGTYTLADFRVEVFL